MAVVDVYYCNINESPYTNSTCSFAVVYPLALICPIILTVDPTLFTLEKSTDKGPGVRTYRVSSLRFILINFIVPDSSVIYYPSDSEHHS